MAQEIPHFSENNIYLSPPVSLKLGQGTKLESALKFVTMIYWCKFEEIHPLVQKIFYLQDYDLENVVKVTRI